MVGSVDMREAKVWLQTDTPAEVTLRWYPEGQEHSERSRTVQTQGFPATTVTAELGPLTPGTTYHYKLALDGEPLALPYATTFTTAPDFRERFPPPEATFAIMGGHYVNERAYDPLNRIPGGGYEIFETVLAQSPDLVFWLGNTAHLREADWGSRSGIFARYDRARQAEQLQPLLAGAAHQAVWSTYDYGQPGTGARAMAQPWAQEAFQTYWANRFNHSDGRQGITSSARWSDVEMFLLDDRSYRDLTSSAPAQRVIYGQEQLTWLLDNLSRSKARFKLVMSGSSLISPAEAPNNFTEAPGEQERFYRALMNRKIEGLFFVSGGKPFGELTKRVRSGGYDLWEATVGPTTARPLSATAELNYFRVPGSATRQRHFLLIEVTGPEACS